MEELKLQIPESTFLDLIEKAKSQGVSIEALCLSMLQTESEVVDPGVYPTLGSGDIRLEVRKVYSSSLSREEKSRRIRLLESQITRRIR
jgi:hypothetical protein